MTDVPEYFGVQTLCANKWLFVEIAEMAENDRIGDRRIQMTRALANKLLEGLTQHLSWLKHFRVVGPITADDVYVYQAR